MPSKLDFATGRCCLPRLPDGVIRPAEGSGDLALSAFRRWSARRHRLNPYCFRGHRCLTVGNRGKRPKICKRYFGPGARGRPTPQAVGKAWSASPARDASHAPASLALIGAASLRVGYSARLDGCNGVLNCDPSQSQAGSGQAVPATAPQRASVAVPQAGRRSALQRPIRASYGPKSHQNINQKSLSAPN